ncbi:MAG: hypothetical protein DRJ65_06755 [Acidobacteria bacterium]|nr:MAG: hypothetical protein DRJ65_06755 [Acidobacteriota bacterium]
MKVQMITLAMLLTTITTGTAGAQCFGRLVEEKHPPAIRGMSTTDAGFTVRYWAWDDFNRRRGGWSRPELQDSRRGIVLTELDWLNADVCLDQGPVDRTAVLFESLGSDGTGLWALVNLEANKDIDIDIDLAQRLIYPPSSRTVPVPRPRIISTRITEETFEIRLDWDLNLRGETLSDLVNDDGRPMTSVRGFAVYVINGPVATARPWDWTRGRDIEPDAVNGYSTDTSAVIRLPRSMWYDVSICFALALTFDGNGDADGELPGSRSVHGEYLGAPSRWLELPADDGAMPILVQSERRRHSSVVNLGFEGQ